MDTRTPLLRRSSLTLILAPRRAQRELMLTAAAQLAQQGEVTVVDGGNLFDAYRVARLIRQHTARLDEALAHLHIARSFTCYQTRALLAALLPYRGPVLVLDLLATFGDETVPASDRQRALADSLASLRRLRASVPVLVSASPAHDRDGARRLAYLREAADQVIELQPPPPPAPPRLF